MTKEELEHDHIKGIAEKYVQESWGSFLDLDSVDLILAGIGVGKIISKEKDDRIAKLEKEIEEQLEYAKTIIQDLLDNSDEYARQRAIDFLKESE